MSKKKGNLSKEQIVSQSEGAYNQWCELWRANAKATQKVKNRTEFKHLEHTGVGKALILVGNGYSLEENIEQLKSERENVDIMVCDKALGHLLDNGIVPDYCFVADARVSYEKYLEPYKDKLQDIVLLSTVTANPQWFLAKWKTVCFFVNEDVINSHLEFSKISGVNHFIPAATNVSNAMVVVATQSNNKARRNLLGYDKYVLIGYDYSWRADGHYYAFDKDGGGKANYMRHAFVVLRDGTIAYSSNNLIFSAKWLEDYIKNFRLPVVLGTDKTILNTVPTKDFSQQLKYSYRKEDSITVRAYLELRDTLAQNLKNIENKLNNIGNDHWLNFQNSI